MLFGEGPQIKNIAADLNKLFRQGSLLNQSGQTVEGDSTADQGTSDLLAARDPVIQEISVGMSGEQSARYTVSGTPPLSLPNSLGKPLKAWSVALSPYQDLHGYDHPWPAGGGVNVLDFAQYFTEGETVTQNGVTATFSNGYLKVTGTNTTTTFNIIHKACNVVLPAGTYIMPSNLNIRCNIDGQGNNNYAGAITAESSVKMVSFYVFASPYATVNYNIPMMLVKGTTRPTEYSPYSNICPILGTDKLNMFVEESYDQSATPKAVLTLPQTVYTGTIGSEGGESRSRMVDLGNTVWTAHSSGNFFAEGFIQNWVAIRTFLCSQYKFAGIVTGVAALTTDMSFAIQPTTNSTLTRLIIRDTTKSALTATEFKSAMSGVQMFYDNVTPTTFSVPSVTIPTPTGNATTWATAEDGTVESMEVTYVGKA